VKTPRLLLIAAGLSLTGPLWGASKSSTPEPHLNYLRGLIEERAGHGAQALEAYQEVVKQDPQAIEVFRDIAQLSLRMGRPEAALKAAERVRELAPKDPASFIFIGNVQVAQGNLAKAAEAYEQALKLDPQNLNALENLGNYYSILDPQKALVYYHKYLDIQPGEAEVYFQIGQLEQKLGNLKESQKAYEKSVELEPHQLASHLALAELFELQKSTPQAVEHYRAAIELQPHNVMIFVRLGHLFYESKDWDAAYSEFQNARSLAPDDASIAYWLARTCEERKQWGEAARYARQAYERTKDNQFLPLAAYYLTLDRKIPEAIAWLEKARKIDPNNANVLLFLGMDYLEINKVKKAKEVLVHGVAKHPNDPQLRFHLAVAEDRLGNTTEAEQQFQAVLNVDPKNTAALNYLGYSWAERGVRLGEAEKLLRQAVALEPNNGAFLDSLGWTRHKQGDRREAIALLEQASKISPEALIFEHLGDAYVADGNYARAAETYAKAAALDPKNSSAAKKAKEASARVLPKTDPRTYLKYVQGNFQQVTRLESRVAISGRWNKRKIEAGASLRYQPKNVMTLALHAAPGTDAARIVVKDGKVSVDPASFEPMLQHLPLASLKTLPEYFSGALAAHFDNDQVRVSTESSTIHYQAQDGAEAWIDAERGVMTGYSRPNAAGGRDQVEFNRYQLVKGVWVPSNIRLSNSKQRLDARFGFSNWRVNGDSAQP
jgi:tetratricopeptide (TPR) repeat protein